MATRHITRHDSPLQRHLTAKSLTRFRRKLETESDEPLSRLEVNVTMLLDDLCRFLGLSQKQRRGVLGNPGADIAHLIDEHPDTH